MQTLMQAMPEEHHAEFNAAMALVPAINAGPVIELIKLLRTLNIPWSKLGGLVPLIAAAIANPTTGLVPLITAIAALFTP
jgi:hypothetical protein